ncbi:copper amine oxidase 1 [Akanthomyces lecanii RCEF 1005]|uniref:Amine oxidase n=1 Tax=Akanthomyces lecanii RCEF 1005 TaxID=1081108 RepID=A0A167QPY9_CORDF|nr:copper amine oxidase 1 [Akanthomyces lecanii RCEF 1005]
MPPTARDTSRTNGTHPLDSLSVDEIRIASGAVRRARKTPLVFRNVFNIEPPKVELLPFLDAERAGFPDPDTPRPPRRACAQYDVIETDGDRYYMESTIDLATGREIATKLLKTHQRAPFTTEEFQELIDNTLADPTFQRVVKDMELPQGWEVAIDPWPYGGSDFGSDYTARLTQLFCFARNMTIGNSDTNHYSYPLPFCVVMNTITKQVLRVERLATGGYGDVKTDVTVSHIKDGHPLPKRPTEHQGPAEYVSEMLEMPLRTDFKPLDVIQPQERAVVVRDRKLIIQFILTLGNYEYIFAYHLDLAGGIYLEARPTGIMSPVAIDAGKTSPYGTVVGPGVLAQNHQHIFAVRIDAAVDGHANTVTVEESLPMPMEPTRNPYGNGYRVESTTIKNSTYVDAAPMRNRIIKISNPSKKNPVSGRPVAYKFSPPATQLLLADPASDIARRAKYAQHHVWVTRHADYEYWAGGEFTNMSREEEGGCFDAAARQDSVENGDVVVWAVFGFTHSPRVEDWPVMPAERFTLHLRPVDFFNSNPALDVPSKKNMASILVDGERCSALAAAVPGK